MALALCWWSRPSSSAYNLVITDAIPLGASYVSGGEPVGGGEVVSWTVAVLPNTASTQVGFVATATQTITNSHYQVTADGGVAAEGQEAVVTAIGGYSTTTRVISYDYDPLYRLIRGRLRHREHFEHAYDAVNNPVSATLRGTNCRLALTETVGLSQTGHRYQYDDANRLVNVDGQAYTWDDNPLRCAARTGVAIC